MKLKLLILRLRYSEMFWSCVRRVLMVLPMIFIALILFDGVVVDLSRMMFEYFLEKYGGFACSVAVVVFYAWVAVTYVYYKYGSNPDDKLSKGDGDKEKVTCD